MPKRLSPQAPASPAEESRRQDLGRSRGASATDFAGVLLFSLLIGAASTEIEKFAGSGSGLLLAQAPQERRIIRKITVEGLRRMSESQVTSQLKIRLGEVYVPRQVQEEAGRLWALGRFRVVRPPEVTDFEDGVAINFFVEEKPVVSRLRFVGRSSLSESHLKTAVPELRTREGELYNDHWVAQDRESIREKYLAAGYLLVQVDHRVEETDDGVAISFIIAEGTRVRIREVSFVGNRAISSSELLGLMSTREKDFWFFGLWRRGFYDREAFQNDVVVLKNYYRRFGYLDVRIEPEDRLLDADKQRMTIVIRIEEGPQYIFQGYRFSGNAVFSEQTLLGLTSAQVGKPFNAERLEADRRQIVNYYHDRAYIFASVAFDPQYLSEGTDVFVRFQIEERNEIYIEEIKIQGNIKTQDRVVRRELEFFPDERIDGSKLRKSQSNLARLQFFRDVSYTFEEGSSPASRNVVVNVEEVESGQLILGFGVTSGFGLIGNFQIIKQNFDITDWPESIYDIPDSFTGAGQTLNLVLQPGTRRSNYRLNFIEPYLFDTRNYLSLSAAKLDLVREQWDESRLSFEPAVGHSFDFDRDLVVTLGARLEEVVVSDLQPGAPQEVVLDAGSTTVVALNVGMNYDKVLYDFLEGPYQGHREAINYEYAGGFLGGHVNFHKLEVRNDFHFPLYVHREQNLHHVISFTNRFGVIEPHRDGDRIPIFERFFLGGPHTVRGFRFRGLGPHEFGSPTGGTTQLYGNLEYSFPIFQKFLRGVVFLDYGDLSSTFSDFTFEEMRLAAGGGVRIAFPFLGGRPLPIGLYFGVPLRKEATDRPRLFLFTIGAPF
jgi:outer membrane protein insertion porin family